MTPAYRYRAKVTRVIDGDTLDVDIDMGFRSWRVGERLRLAGIDTPEIRGAERPEGLRSKDYVQGRMPVGSEIVIKTEKDPDAFGRWIADVYDDMGHLNTDLVDLGLAEKKSY